MYSALTDQVARAEHRDRQRALEAPRPSRLDRGLLPRTARLWHWRE